MSDDDDEKVGGAIAGLLVALMVSWIGLGVLFALISGAVELWEWWSR